MDAAAPLDEAMTGPGRLVNSDVLDGMAVDEAKEAMCAKARRFGTCR